MSRAFSKSGGPMAIRNDQHYLLVPSAVCSKEIETGALHRHKSASLCACSQSGSVFVTFSQQRRRGPAKRMKCASRVSVGTRSRLARSKSSRRWPAVTTCHSSRTPSMDILSSTSRNHRRVSGTLSHCEGAKVHRMCGRYDGCGNLNIAAYWLAG